MDSSWQRLATIETKQNLESSEQLNDAIKAFNRATGRGYAVQEAVSSKIWEGAFANEARRFKTLYDQISKPQLYNTDYADPDTLAALEAAMPSAHFKVLASGGVDANQTTHFEGSLLEHTTRQHLARLGLPSACIERFAAMPRCLPKCTGAFDRMCDKVPSRWFRCPCFTG
jgi:hypothetical protein